MSYYLCKGPAVGASGAIFGLVGLLEILFIHISTLASLTNDFKHWSVPEGLENEIYTELYLQKV